MPGRKPWALSALYQPFSPNEPRARAAEVNEAEPSTEPDEVS